MLRRIALVLILGGILSAAACYFYVSSRIDVPGALETSKLILIPPGTGTQKIGDILEREGVISSRFLLYFAVKTSPEKSVFMAGEYEFTPHISLRDVLLKMRKGDVYVRQFTIPEGLTSFQIVEIIKSVPELTGDVDVIPPEGMLYPDTYHYTRGDTRADVLNKLQVRMEKILHETWASRSPDTILKSPTDALILASIVEKETGVGRERPIIAGVFLNRLQRGMPLQSDPTVIYAMTQGVVQQGGQGPIGRRLLTKDLGLDSPYNTYRNTGLPPAPIACPGREALEAVLHPAVHDYVFFVADGSGGHVFASSLAEHNRNVAQWRNIRRAQENR